MAAGKILVPKALTNRPKNMLIYVDRQGNIRGTKLARGGKRGRKVCRG